MTRPISKSSEGVRITVGDLITELCRWPDHATIKFRCPDRAVELCFSRVEGVSKSSVEIELHAATEAAPIVPA